MMDHFTAPSSADCHIQLYMNEVVFGTGFGILLGPHVLDIFDPRSWTGITDILTRELMRIVLAIGLFTIGIRLPNRYMADHARGLLIMVVPTMAFGWFVSAGKCAGIRTPCSLDTTLKPSSMSFSRNWTWCHHLLSLRA